MANQNIGSMVGGYLDRGITDANEIYARESGKYSVEDIQRAGGQDRTTRTVADIGDITDPNNQYNRFYGKAITVPVQTTITSDTLAGGERPIEIPKVTPSTIAGRVSGKTQALLTEDELQQKAVQKAEEDRVKLQESQSKSQSLLEQIGIKKKEVTKELGGGIPLLKQEAVDARNKLRASQVAELGELELLQKSGLTDVQRGARETEIRRKYGFEQLETQLSYYMSTENLSSVQDVLNDRLTLELEPLYQQLDLQKEVSEQIYDQLTTSEKREWDLVVGRTENAIAERKELEKYKASLITTAMENGVNIPSYVLNELNRAGSEQEAAQVLARNRISLADPLDRQIKRAQLAKLGVELDKARLENISLQAGATTPYQKERQIRTLQSVDELRQRVNFQTVGVGSLGRFVPASLPRNFRTDLDTLKATIAFGELTAMREASKTGGALGQVSNIELGLLESALGGLDQGQSPANFRKNLNKIEASIKRWQGAANAVSEEDQLRALGYTEEQIQQIKSAQ